MCLICLNNDKKADVAGEEPVKGGSNRIRALMGGQGVVQVS